MAQFTIALDSAGNKINIMNAPEHEKYTCINCKLPMKARKGDIREWHFSHHNDSPKCNHDSWLHKSLLNALTERLDNSDPMVIESPEGNINLTHISYEREHKFENCIPDILIKREKEVLFIEVCVTSPCSKDKIDSGNKIIEIYTCKDEAIEELSSGPINSNAQYYELKFYNFTTKEKEEIFTDAPTDIPDILSDELKVNRIAEQERQKLDSKTVKEEHHCYFIVHSDKSYELKDFLVFTTNDLLVLGINTVKDFAINIGKSYAWRKGLIDRCLLSNYEIHIDMQAVIKAFNVTEYHIE